MKLLALLLSVLFSIVQGVHFGAFKRDNCRGEDAYGRGVRQYSARLYNIPWGSPRRNFCVLTKATINGFHFERATRCVRAGTFIFGEFDVPDPTCNVDRKWVLYELEKILGFPFLCDWSRYLSNGCSVPLHDAISILYKDKFNKACVFHDYCYASPWGKTREGKDKCDIRFKELMDETCRGTYSCLVVSTIYYLAVKAAAGSIFDKVQETVEYGEVSCQKYPPGERPYKQ